MNRNDEFDELVNRLDDTPPALQYTLERAKARRKSRRHRRAVLAPLGSVATVFAVFVLLVNFSPAFAKAASSVPFLKDLVSFVSFSHSLSAAVDNDYVQVIGQEQTKDGITARVEYVIVDQKQLNIFYTLESEEYASLDSTPSIRSAGPEALLGYSVISSGIVTGGELRQASIDIQEGYDMPGSVVFITRVQGHASAPPGEPYSVAPVESYGDEFGEPEYITSFEFVLEFDPYFTVQGEFIDVNETFIIDGQSLTLVSAEVYPTHMRLNFDASDANTAWLRDLAFHVTDESGKDLGSMGTSSGLHSTGAADSPAMQTYYYDSPYFTGSKHLTLHIEGATWLAKDKQKIHIDLEEKSAEWLPDGVYFESAEKSGNDWILVFHVPMNEDGGAAFSWNGYYWPDGEEGYFRWVSYTPNGGFDESGGSAYYEVMLPLENYPHDEVWLKPSKSHNTSLGEPIEIQIK